MATEKKFTDQELENNWEFFRDEYLDKYPASSYVPDEYSTEYMDWLLANEGYL